LEISSWRGNGQGSLTGISFGHCWIEVGNDIVIDKSNGNNILMRRSKYYELGKIDKLNNLKKYDYIAFAKAIGKYGHWGPWDLKTKTGL